MTEDIEDFKGMLQMEIFSSEDGFDDVMDVCEEISASGSLESFSPTPLFKFFESNEPTCSHSDFTAGLPDDKETHKAVSTSVSSFMIIINYIQKHYISMAPSDIT